MYLTESGAVLNLRRLLLFGQDTQNLWLPFQCLIFVPNISEKSANSRFSLVCYRWCHCLPLNMYFNLVLKVCCCTSQKCDVKLVHPLKKSLSWWSVSQIRNLTLNFPSKFLNIVYDISFIRISSQLQWGSRWIHELVHSKSIAYPKHKTIYNKIENGVKY